MAPHEHAKFVAGDSNILPRYTCPLFQIDCGGGFCCPVGQTCFNNGGQTTCRLPPGIPGSDQPASPAPGATTSSAAPSSTSSTSASSTTSSSPTVMTTTISSTSTTTASAAASTSGGSISGSGIAGIVVGFVVLAAFVGASVWSLMRRRRKERERESTLLPDNGSGKSDGASAFLGGGGGGGGGRSRSMEQQQSPQSAYQNSSPQMSQFGGFGQHRQQRSPASRHSQRPSWGGNVDDHLVDMYAGSNVGKKPGEVPGRVEAMGDMPPVQPPSRAITRKKVGGQNMGPVFEMEGSPITRQAV